MIDTVIFDLDGTLMNTLEDLTDSVNYSLELNGYPKRDIEEIRKFVGNGVEKLVERSLPDNIDRDILDRVLKEFKLHYSDNMRNKTRPYDGIIRLLETLKENRYKMAIVSNKFDKAVKELNTEYFSEYISVAIGEKKGIDKKPAPDSVYQSLKELNSSVENTVYVGDSDIDVETAKNSGVKMIGVTWGFRDKDVLEAKGADYIADNIDKLYQIICNI